MVVKEVNGMKVLTADYGKVLVLNGVENPVPATEVWISEADDPADYKDVDPEDIPQPEDPPQYDPGEYVEPEVTRYSRLKICLALEELGLWERAKAWLIEKGYYDKFYLASYLEEGYPIFTEGYEAFLESTGMSEESGREILNKCIDEQ